MATAPQPLSLEQFRERYAEEKPYYEYWFGEAVQKSVPAFLNLERIAELALPNGQAIAVESLWSELARRTARP